MPAAMAGGAEPGSCRLPQWPTAPRRTAGRRRSGQDAAKIEGVPSPRAGSPEDGAGPAPKDAQPGGSRLGANGRSDTASTRRKSVVFEEDDELDVPDFLK